ncbi:MAG: efflux RND transporter periplasmic adaptor subunit [Phycisphaerales bacterium JB039]
MKLLVGLGITGAVLGAGGFLAFQAVGGADGLREKFAKTEEIPEVRTRIVERGDLTRMVNAPGLIEPEISVDISARVSARITALPFKVGDSVKQGDVVVRLDAEDLQARLDAAEARLRSEEARLAGAQADLRLAELDLGRRRELFDSKDIAKAELDASEAQYNRAMSSLKAAEANIESARANVAEARRDLENAVIASPIDGVITAVNNEVGETVLGTFNNAGSVIMVIADLSRMLMRARVDETNIAPVKAGQKARVYVLSYPDEVFDGVVQRVHLTRQLFRDGTSYVEAEILVNKEEGDLRFTGLNANADIEVQTLRDVVIIPSQAVVDRRIDEMDAEIIESSPHADRNKTFARVVYRYVDGKAIATPISVGSSDLTRTVVLGGLEAGDEIVIGPYRVVTELKHDVAVRKQGETTDQDTGAETDASGAEAQAESGATPADDAADQQPVSAQHEGQDS